MRFAQLKRLPGKSLGAPDVFEAPRLAPAGQIHLGEHRSVSRTLGILTPAPFEKLDVAVTLPRVDRLREDWRWRSDLSTGRPTAGGQREERTERGTSRDENDTSDSTRHNDSGEDVGRSAPVVGNGRRDHEWLRQDHRIGLRLLG
jgi:hypothetical protein